MLALTMSHGAKGSMVYPPELLLTINRVLVSPNGIVPSVPIQNVSSRLSFFFDFCTLDGLIRRTVVSIPNGPSALAVKEAAWGLARYAAISQVNTHCFSFKQQVNSDSFKAIISHADCVLCFVFSGQWIGSNSGARDIVGRRTRHRQDLRSSREGLG